MNSNSAPLISKLILAALVGILVCLVLLVVRQGQPAPAKVVELSGTPPTEPVQWPSPTQTEPAVKHAARPASTRAPRNTIPRPDAPGPRPGARPYPSDSSPSEPTPASVELTPPGPGFTAVAQPVVTTFPADFPPAIHGTTTLIGTPPPEISIDLGPSCGRLNSTKRTTRHFVVGSEGQLANVLVYVKDGLGRSFTPAGAVPLLDQVGCMFEPYVMAVMAGQPLQIRNSDPELHNVHATPRINREFNFGQTSRGQVDQRVFDHPELFIRVKCDVHPWMFAYVSVLDHPFFAVTDTNGFFALPAGLPPGHYTLNAVHQKAGEETQEIELRPDEQPVVNFQFKAEPVARSSGRMARTSL